jgi:predicted nucleic-acid-binding Zn-ribbon protein
MTGRDLKCPQCGCADLDCRQLGVKGARWQVMFGHELFKKEEMLAYACQECGFVFLQLLKVPSKK